MPDLSGCYARLSLTCLLEATEAARWPAPREIVLETPVSGPAVGTSIELPGWISTASIENTLTCRVYK